jgi:hypothetical protein
LLKKSLNGQNAVGAFLCLLVLSTASAGPFLTQDQNPFSLIHGQPQPTSATLPAEGSLNWSLGLDITNTLNGESNSQENLFIDFESYHLRLGLLYGISENWALSIDIPYIYYGGGFLDSAVENWHDTFGLPQGGRPNVANDQFNIFYSRNGMPVIDLDTSSGGLSDIQFALGRQIVKNTQTAFSAWASIDVPTGEANELRGNDASDLAFWLAASYRFHPEWVTDANLGVLHPGENQLGALVVEDNILFGYAGIQWSPYYLFDLRIQLAGHTQFYNNSDLLLLGESYNIVFGGTVHVSACSDLDIAVSEDLKEGASPDFSFLFTWKSKTGDCKSTN